MEGAWCAYANESEFELLSLVATSVERSDPRAVQPWTGGESPHCASVDYYWGAEIMPLP